ncbi:hypothetical protein TNCV_1845621 [Trichonephila clavipes]|nr:hypothetical protein TNCV_1845621 [Trichonephila clavipes]
MHVKPIGGQSLQLVDCKRSERERTWCAISGVSNLGNLSKGRQTKIGDKICVRECLNSSQALIFCGGLPVYSGEDSSRNTISFSDWSEVMAEGYLPAVHNSPKTRKFPKTSHTMMYLWVHCLLPGVGNASPFFGGVRGTPRNSSACKQQQGLYTNYCCNPYGKAAPITPPLSD